MKEQTKYISDKINEAKDAHPDIDPILWVRLDDLLWDSLSCRDLKPFSINVHGDRVGVWWEDDTSSAWAMFSPHTTDWTWTATTIKDDGSTEDDSSYTVTYRHSGKCSFVYKDIPHYFFPDEVEEIVSVPDAFRGEYGPLFKRWEWRLLWETNRYDGMLSGYISIKGKTYYASMVEETDFQRKRMYAVYELPWHERVGAHLRHWWWMFVRSNKVLWTIWWKLARKRKPVSADKHHAQIKKFRDTHRVVGYFEG